MLVSGNVLAAVNQPANDVIQDVGGNLKIATPKSNVIQAPNQRMIVPPSTSPDSTSLHQSGGSQPNQQTKQPMPQTMPMPQSQQPVPSQVQEMPMPQQGMQPSGQEMPMPEQGMQPQEMPAQQQATPPTQAVPTPQQGEPPKQTLPSGVSQSQLNQMIQGMPPASQSGKQ